MSSQRILRKYAWIVSWVLLGLTIAPQAHAKLEELTLIELYEEAAYIAYGETYQNSNPSPDTSSGYLVRFKPMIVLKNTQDEKTDFVLLCNDFNGIESYYDLRIMEGPYFVFAEKEGSCLMPLSGRYSIFGAFDDTVNTFGIADQPEEQKLNSFMDKIRELVDQGK